MSYSTSVILLLRKIFTCPSGKLSTEFTSPIAKSTSPGLSDTTFFARCIPISTIQLSHQHIRKLTCSSPRKHKKKHRQKYRNYPQRYYFCQVPKTHKHSDKNIIHHSILCTELKRLKQNKKNEQNHGVFHDDLQ